MKYTFFLIFALVATNVDAQETNIFYFPEGVAPNHIEEPHFSFDTNLPPWVIQANKLALKQWNLGASNRAALALELKEAAVKSGECRPAELDPEGNWGAINQGFQMSIRAKTNIFVLGQSIPITVILRNTTTNDIASWDAPEMTYEVENVNLHLTNSLGVSQVSRSGFSKISARHQINFEDDLKSKGDYSMPKYSFNVGTYRIWAKRVAFDQWPVTNMAAGAISISSGALEIKIVQP